tara:strand:- start:46 stop:555 length:510 start_codon:yes stop_codon:yes gene_type:complete
MPKLAINYSNTIIYKIVCKDVTITDCYVGQTTNFTQRKYHHTNDCNNYTSKSYDVYVYKFIREHGSWENWDMIEIEKYNAIDKLDALKRERFWIETLQAKLNKCMPTRTPKEHYIENKEEFAKRNKLYRDQNKEQIINNQKKYWEQNKEEINARRRLNRALINIKKNIW